MTTFNRPWLSLINGFGSKKSRRSQQHNSGSALRSRRSRFESLEQRLVLFVPPVAVGSFQRIDGVVGNPSNEDPDVYSYSINWTEASDLDLNPSGDSSDLEPMVAAEEKIARSYDGESIQHGDGFGSGIGQSLSQILTEIGQFTVMPTVTQVANQLTAARSTETYESSGFGLAATDTALRGDFQYADETLGNGAEGFYGAVHFVGIGGGVAAGNAAGWDVDANLHIQVWKRGAVDELLANLYASGEGGGDTGDPGSTEWSIWGNVVGYEDPISESGTQLNVYIPFVSTIADGEVIVFTTQNSVLGIIDGATEIQNLGFGISSQAESYAQDQDTGGVADSEAVFGEAINAFGYAYPAGTFAFTPGVIVGPPAPADLNGDGVLDGIDSKEWVEELGRQSQGEGTVLMVTNAVDELDTDFDLDTHSSYDLSFREALALAAENEDIESIVFAPWVQEILLDGNELAIDSDIEIIGPGADQLTIDAQGDSRVFNIVGSTTDVTIRGVHITGGNSTSGGGIANGGNLTLDAVQLDWNTASLRGGGIYHSGGSNTLTVINSTIANNIATGITATGAGGGAYTLSPATFINSTISNNTGTNGAGGINFAATGGQLINCTVTENTSSGAGGGIRALTNVGPGGGGVGTSALLYNTIVADNNGPSMTKDIAGTFNSSSANNVIGKDSNLNNGINNGVNSNQVGGQSGGPLIDPMLGALDYYGGPTMTHEVLSGSPAIDEGNDTYANGLDYDQRGFGFDRILDGGSSLTVDVGAVEYSTGGGGGSALLAYSEREQPIELATLSDRSGGEARRTERSFGNPKRANNIVTDVERPNDLAIVALQSASEKRRSHAHFDDFAADDAKDASIDDVDAYFGDVASRQLELAIEVL